MKRPAALLAVALLLLSFAFVSYRIIWLKYPLFPPAPEKAWKLDMEARLTAHQKEVNVKIGFPYTHAEQIVVEERITSGRLTFNLLREGPNQVGVWSGDVGPEEEVISYRATILMTPQRSSKIKPRALEPYPATLGMAEQVLAERLVSKWSHLPPPARLRAVAAAAAGSWGTPPPDGQDLRQWSAIKEKHGRRVALLVLLRAANLSARAVEGLSLIEGITAEPIQWVEVWTGREWENVKPETGEIYERSASSLPLTTGGLPAVRVSQGELSEVR